MSQGTLSPARRTRFREVSGKCLDCAGDISAGLKRVPGIEDVEVFPTSGVLVIDHAAGLTPEEVRRHAARLGLSLQPAAMRVESREGSWWQQPEQLALAVSGLLLVLGLIAEKLLGLAVPATALYLAAIAIGGFFPARSGLKALRTGRLTISTLLVAATSGAMALGIFEEAALLVVVFSLGEVLEEYASDRARGAIRALMALAPQTAVRRTEEGTLETVPVEGLLPGEVIVVKPGERLPTDGEVSNGSSAVDMSPVTGESVPVEVGVGAKVFGGTVNGHGALDVRVTKEYADTTLARIIRQVEEAQASKARAQRFADRFGAVYTPAMFALATALAVVPPMLGGDFREWFYRALVVLTVSCSCALVLSVPVAVVAAISRAARDGILLKGGAYLDALGEARAVAFDKTGTLTQGRPRVTDVMPLGGQEPNEILRLAASVEAHSEHPLAGAVLRAAEERGLSWVDAEGLRSLPGVGVEATVDGQRFFIGKPGERVGADVAKKAEALEAEGKTVVVLLREAEPLGLLAVADEVREGAAAVVSELRALGIEHVLMLTGDNERVAAAIARQLGIDDWRAGLLPEDKTAAIQSLRARYGAIAMVGDGVNDAPALARADVGIAMGAAGTDVALETADVALMADDLSKLPEAIHLSRRAGANLRQNIALSLIVIAVLIAAALLGKLSLTSGLLLNEGAALLIIANALRLLAPAKKRLGNA